MIDRVDSTPHATCQETKCTQAATNARAKVDGVPHRVIVRLNPMNRTARNTLLVFLATFHFLADAAFAGGAILCIGPDDHLAIESSHEAELGCESIAQVPAEAAPEGLSRGGPLTEDCTDRVLHAEAELVSSKQETTASVATHSTPAESLSAANTDSPTDRPQVRSPIESAAHRAVRITVLIV